MNGFVSAAFRVWFSAVPAGPSGSRVTGWHGDHADPDHAAHKLIEIAYSVEPVQDDGHSCTVGRRPNMEPELTVPLRTVGCRCTKAAPMYASPKRAPPRG